MPYASAAQEKFMNAVRHNPAFAKRVNVSKSVADKFASHGKSILDKAKKHGRHGDTDIVHVNSKEKKMLKRAGGAGTINPKTGLREYYSDPSGGVRGPANEAGHAGHTGASGAAGASSRGGSERGGTGARGPTGPTGKPTHTGLKGPAGSATRSASESAPASGKKKEGNFFDRVIDTLFGGFLTDLEEKPAQTVLGTIGDLSPLPGGELVGSLIGMGLDAVLGALGPPDGPGKGAVGGLASGQGGGIGNNGLNPNQIGKPKQVAGGTQTTPTTPNTPTTPTTPGATNPNDAFNTSLADILLKKYSLPGINAPMSLTPFAINNQAHEQLLAQYTVPGAKRSTV